MIVWSILYFSMHSFLCFTAFVSKCLSPQLHPGVTELSIPTFIFSLFHLFFFSQLGAFCFAYWIHCPRVYALIGFPIISIRSFFCLITQSDRLQSHFPSSLISQTLAQLGNLFLVSNYLFCDFSEIFSFDQGSIFRFFR